MKKFNFKPELDTIDFLTKFVTESMALNICNYTRKRLLGMIKVIKDQINVKDNIVKHNMGEVSDGYHTFNELYHHRAILFAVICNEYRHLAWKSLQHHDPSQPMYDGMFIVGISTPMGQATYHYDIDPYWDKFNNIPEYDRAPEWDGHTPEEAIKRIESLMNMPYNFQP